MDHEPFGHASVDLAPLIARRDALRKRVWFYLIGAGVCFVGSLAVGKYSHSVEGLLLIVFLLIATPVMLVIGLVLMGWVVALNHRIKAAQENATPPNRTV
jgi:uncharacterized membrane protein YccC